MLAKSGPIFPFMVHTVYTQHLPPFIVLQYFHKEDYVTNCSKHEILDYAPL
jgi:hypothetical protein